MEKDDKPAEGGQCNDGIFLTAVDSVGRVLGIREKQEMGRKM